MEYRILFCSRCRLSRRDGEFVVAAGTNGGQGMIRLIGAGRALSEHAGHGYRGLGGTRRRLVNGSRAWRGHDSLKAVKNMGTVNAAYIALSQLQLFQAGGKRCAALGAARSEIHRR